MQVILASASPRRQELLRQVGLEPVVCPSDFAEAGGGARQARSVVLANAAGKCRSVAARKGDALPVVAADTVVVADDKILGKPGTEAAAQEMLRLLSGRCHEVLTGVAVQYRGKFASDVCTTRVYFRSLTEAEIAAYAATGEPLDKAGAYGIQGRGALLVEKIEGCYNNVVGLPLTRLYAMLAGIGAMNI